ncbi:hypothetical protein NGTWS0302_05740 [Mycolicibacterium cyprinidarum]|uniref:Winged helix DNA-binding domain-containing protein n=1 Tax=Mycolicibacterium cyprinidarum TaxID=2860311 RepID=A0ABQ4VG70_9MYCO|nr:hypothetical protein NGTWS0302_05740 [Mycolicibacterium sp. NGTWS0302]GJF14738.1 hypothetical protein NGTWS1702_17060 [Mycolicibacterium sp. NGTWSNA01]
MHATDPATPYLSLWAPLPDCSVDDVNAAFYTDRTLVKHLAMRRTLWAVRPEDLPSIQSAASDRVAANEGRTLIADVEGAGWRPMDRPHRDQVFDRYGNADPTVWINGRVVGAWHQDTDGRVQLVLLEDVGRRAQRKLLARADELTAWLGDVRVKPRFPSPASKGASTATH